MKYLILIPDGMADWRIKKLGYKTPLEFAETPNMDFIAENGSCGLAYTIPKGFSPGSDIANLTILGIDVKKYYTGRGPIEALARDIKGKFVFRCNLVRVENGVLVDYAGGRISDNEARKVIKELNERIKHNYIKFYPGRSYRNLCVIDREYDEEVVTFPPHDIQGKKIDEYLPRNGKLAELLQELMEWSKNVVSEVTDLATMIWLWGGGRMPNFPNFYSKYRLKGAMISEVDLLEGIAKGLGMDVLKVDGLTGYIDTNYKGLVKQCIKAVKSYDLTVLHTEGIDEVSHEGNVELKVEAIEIYDEKIVGKILDKVDLEEIRILLLPDHPTPIAVRTHVAEPVPFAIYGLKNDDVREFNERSCAKGRFGKVNGLNLIKILKT